MKTKKPQPPLTLPLEKGEKIIQITACDETTWERNAFKALTNKGKIYGCYHPVKEGGEAYYTQVEWVSERII